MAKRKRWHIPVAKPGQLIARFGREYGGGRPDLLYAYGGGGASKPDSRILMNALEEAKIFEDRSLRQELELRGYDITTLRFSIERAAEN